MVTDRPTKTSPGFNSPNSACASGFLAAESGASPCAVCELGIDMILASESKANQGVSVRPPLAAGCRPHLINHVGGH